MRKGQAAMEFLMTYGWAILVVLAAIGALAYFGVLSPDRFLPDKCTANPPFACTEYKISQSNNQVYFVLQNSAGVDVAINSVTLSCDGDTTTAAMTVGNTTALILNGNTVNATLGGGSLPSGCQALTAGNKFRATYAITYTKSGESVSHTGSGSIQARVEA